MHQFIQKNWKKINGSSKKSKILYAVQRLLLAKHHRHCKQKLSYWAINNYEETRKIDEKTSLVQQIPVSCSEQKTIARKLEVIDILSYFRVSFVSKASSSRGDACATISFAFK